MRRELITTERLVVAVDFKLKDVGSLNGLKEKFFQFVKNLEGLGVVIKANSILRVLGYRLIHDLHELGLQVFADLKVNDIPNTLENDGGLLSVVEPDLLTVMCSTGVGGMRELKDALTPRTKVLGVTALTSLDEEECQQIYGCSTKAAVLRFARMAQAAKLDGLILSPKEVPVITARKGEFELELVTPGIRPVWSVVKEDDQSRVLTPGEAIRNGSDRLVIGRPITQAQSNDQGLPQNPREAVERTLEEIEEALAA